MRYGAALEVRLRAMEGVVKGAHGKGVGMAYQGTIYHFPDVAELEIFSRLKHMRTGHPMVGLSFSSFKVMHWLETDHPCRFHCVHNEGTGKRNTRLLKKFASQGVSDFFRLATDYYYQGCFSPRNFDQAAHKFKAVMQLLIPYSKSQANSKNQGRKNRAYPTIFPA